MEAEPVEGLKIWRHTVILGFLMEFTTGTIRNKQENFEGKAEAKFYAPFKAQSQLENMSKIMGVMCEGCTNRA